MLDGTDFERQGNANNIGFLPFSTNCDKAINLLTPIDTEKNVIESTIAIVQLLHREAHASYNIYAPNNLQ